MAQKVKEVIDREDIPAEVVDIEAYREYQKLMDEKNLTQWVQTSDPNLDFNTCSLPHMANTALAHLPAEEREELYQLVMEQRSRLSRIGVLKKKAFNLGYGRGAGGVVSLPTILGAERTAEVLDLFGSMYTLKDVHRVICEDWGISDVTITVLNNWRIKQLDKIAERQEAFKRDFGHLRLTHKRARLEELTYLYYHRKNIYEKTNSQQDYKLLLDTITNIKREVEGDKIVIDGKIELDIKSTVNAHTQKEILGRLNLLTIVVSRISARVGINPIWMMTKLVNSYYAKFSGMQFNEDSMNDQILYPNNQSYDFEQIKMMHENMKLRDQPLRKLNFDITPQESNVALDAKEKLKRMIQAKKDALNTSEQHLDIVTTDKKPSNDKKGAPLKNKGELTISKSGGKRKPPVPKKKK